MTENDLPAAIQAFIEATNRGDSTAYAAGTDNMGVRSHFDLVSAEPGTTPGSYTVTLTVTGDGFNGTGPLNFQLRDGRIASLRDQLTAPDNRLALASSPSSTRRLPGSARANPTPAVSQSPDGERGQAGARLRFGAVPRGHTPVAAGRFRGRRPGRHRRIFTNNSAWPGPDGRLRFEAFAGAARRATEEGGQEVCFVRITAPLTVLTERVAAESRREHGKLLDAARLREMVASLDETSLYPDDLVMDTSVVSPDEAAQVILQALRLPAGT
jgi:hypothetical protein